VVSLAKSSGLNNFAELTTFAASRYRARASRPAAPFRNGSILLMARPPLLFKEGNICSNQFIHTFIERA
jgi:hypothetical protein